MHDYVACNDMQSTPIKCFQYSTAKFFNLIFKTKQIIEISHSLKLKEGNSNCSEALIELQTKCPFLRI